MQPTMFAMMQELLELVSAKKGVPADARAAVDGGIAKMRELTSPALRTLGSADKVSLAQLTLFPNQFSLAAAAAVLGLSEEEAQQRLSRLSSKALVLISQQNSHRLQHNYQLHLFVRGMAADGCTQTAAFVSAQQRFLQFHISMLQSAEYYFAPQLGTGYTFAQLAKERSNLIRLFHYLRWQQLPDHVDSDSINTIKQLCRLGLPALCAITDLQLDETMIADSLRNLVKWCRQPTSAPQLKGSLVNAQEQLGYYLAERCDKPREARKLLTAVLKVRRAQAAGDSFSLVLPLFGMASAEASITSRSWTQSQHILAGLRAHTCLREAFSILKHAKGIQHPYTLHCMYLIGCYMDNPSARSYMLQDLMHFSRLCLGPAHAFPLALVGKLAADLAEFGLEDGEADEAVTLSRELVAAYTEAGDITSAADATVTLADSLLHTFEPASEQEGLLAMRQAVSLKEQEFGSGSLEALEVRLDGLVPALVQTQQYDEAIEVMLQDQPMWSLCGSDHKKALMSVNVLIGQWLADAYCGKGELPRAEQHLKALAAELSKSRMKRMVGPEEIRSGQQDLSMRLAAVLACQGR